MCSELPRRGSRPLHALSYSKPLPYYIYVDFIFQGFLTMMPIISACIGWASRVSHAQNERRYSFVTLSWALGPEFKVLESLLFPDSILTQKIPSWAQWIWDDFCIFTLPRSKGVAEQVGQMVVRMQDGRSGWGICPLPRNGSREVSELNGMERSSLVWHHHSLVQGYRNMWMDKWSWA